MPVDEITNRVPDRLIDLIGTGQCVLFLGAGVSLDAGAPDGKELSNELAETFGLPPGYPLAETAAFVDAQDGRRAMNDWIKRRLERLVPSAALAQIPTFRWRAIYTTNYDTLVEDAYRANQASPQRPWPIYSDRDQISLVGPEDVPIYKLHGCISRSNTDEGRLIITQDDFAAAEESRRRLFNRLVDDVADSPVFYVGFGRADPDFARTLATVEKAVGQLKGMSRSYALHPGFIEPEQRRAELKKVTLINSGADEAFRELDRRISLNPEAPDASASLFHSALLGRRPGLSSELLETLAEDFDILDDSVANETADLDAFFEGSSPSWGDIAADADALRDVNDPLLEAMLTDPDLDRSFDQLVLIHAEAGAGKSTAARRAALELNTTWDRVVLSLKTFGALDFLTVEQLVSALDERVFIVVDDVLRVTQEVRTFLAEARRAKSRITILAVARTNEWRESRDAAAMAPAAELEIQALSSDEIDRMIAKLDEHNKLGSLDAADHAGRREAFVSRAQKQLLVALREATEGNEFDEIVVDEYRRIPSEDAKRAYLHIAALHRFNLFTRAGVLHRALQVPISELGSRVFGPAAKIVVAKQLSRNNEPYYSTRHPLIAEIVFDRIVTGEEQRLSFYLSLIRELDLGYASDADTYRRLSRSLNKKLLRDFGRQSHKRELMEEIQRLDPTDAYVHQHAAMMELAAGDLRIAASHIRNALAMRPDDPAIRDTEGRIVLAGVERESTTARKLAKLSEAESIFRGNIRARPQEPFGYRHLAETLWLRSTIETDEVTRGEYLGNAYAALDRGLSEATSTAMLHHYRAALEDDLGNRQEARTLLAAALRDKPEDISLRLMASRLADRASDPEAAIALLREGLETAPDASDAWEMHYQLALLLERGSDASPDEVKRHFSAALLAPLRRYRPRLAYAAWLFSIGDYDAADRQFAKLQEIEVPARERTDSRQFQFGDLGTRHVGRVSRVSMDRAWTEFDGGATRVFFRRWDLQDHEAPLSIGSRVSYSLRFNFRGPVAKDVEVLAGRV
ncbi:MAG: SIR2 family protein [Patulibacter sp.]